MKVAYDCGQGDDNMAVRALSKCVLPKRSKARETLRKNQYQDRHPTYSQKPKLQKGNIWKASIRWPKKVLVRGIAIMKSIEVKY